jgi:hypothetical protein
VALNEILDDGREGATLRMSKRSAINRRVITLLMGVLLLAEFGWGAAIAWGAASLVLEILLAANHRYFAYSQAAGRRVSRAQRLVTPTVISLTWSGMAAASWVYGSGPMQLAALLILFGIVIEALKYAALSRAAFVALIPWPMLSLVSVPILLTGFSGWRWWCWRLRASAWRSSMSRAPCAAMRWRSKGPRRRPSRPTRPSPPSWP